ncbi:MAG: hypothetical protein XXXJIFNMEKO3_01361 [Candidatus Erwinia impunctatus]|nr:hypothetical protein XXXJIFNMEKO_01361 [Culicoides impunctatus]
MNGVFRQDAITLCQKRYTSIVIGLTDALTLYKECVQLVQKGVAEEKRPVWRKNVTSLFSAQNPTLFIALITVVVNRIKHDLSRGSVLKSGAIHPDASLIITKEGKQ